MSIAEDMVNGKCCDLCGCYFTLGDKPYEHGHPATCEDCYDDLTIKEKKLHGKCATGVETF